MENKDLVCPICGEPTNVYYGNARKDRLCYKHGQMLKREEIILKEDGIFIDAKTSEILNSNYKNNNLSNVEKNVTENNKTSKCIVCGKSTKNQQCSDCFSETQEFMKVLNKNANVRETRDYYYNLKERIFIIKNLEETQKQCNKLIAIATVAKFFNKDNSLIDRVYKDVESLITNKKTPQAENKLIEEKQKETDEIKSKINTSQDGHNVDSAMEVTIDDVLYNAYILHSYGISIPEITEKRKKCDWFIPISNGKGIYIEYWGMNTPKYIEERKEKEELYKKHNIPYISIEADDPKQDTLTFRANLLRELRIKAEEHYGFMPEWKR